MKSRPRIKILLALLLTLSIAAGALTGCSSKKSSINTTLTVAFPADITSLTPATAYNNYDNGVLQQIVEGLFAYTSDSEITPVLATGYKIVNPTTYVYDIRKNVKFSDGTPLTAEDVVFSLDYQKTPSNNSQLSWMFANVKDIKQTGDYQVTITLNKADALWKDALATTAGLVFSKKYYLSHKSTFGKASGGIVGTGPYIYKSWVSDSEIDLAKNTNYWDHSKTLPFDKIVYKIIKDDSSRLRAAQSGQVDLVYGLTNDQLSQIKTSKNLNYTYTDTFATSYLTFNTKREPFTDVNVRKAIYYAIDKASILKYIIKESGSASTSLLIDNTYTDGKTALWSDYIKNAQDYTYNLSTAKEYLSKSSKPNGFAFTLDYSGSSFSLESVALSIQQSLEKIGITVKLNKITNNQFGTFKFDGALKNGQEDFDVLLDGWGSDFPDADGILTPLLASWNIVAGGSNDAFYTDNELDGVLRKEIATQDNTARAKLLQQAFTLVSDRLPYAPLYHPKMLYVYNKRLKVQLSPSNLYNFFYKDFTIVKK